MWAADFLPNEGFDGTRISIFGSGNKKDPAKECFDKVAEYLRKSELVTSSPVACCLHVILESGFTDHIRRSPAQGAAHSVILVEFLSREASGQSVAREVSETVQTGFYTPAPNQRTVS